MKWFQVDADTPNDPKIRAIVRDVGLDALGGLFLIWCHIADHGKKPGWSLDSLGHPIPEAELMEVSRLPLEKWANLVKKCVELGHFQPQAWQKRKVIALPAMCRRADTYTKRVVRSDFEVGSKSLRSNFAIQDKTKQNKTRGRASSRRNAVCPHTPRCETRHECIEKTLREARERRQG